MCLPVVAVLLACLAPAQAATDAVTNLSDDYTATGSLTHEVSYAAAGHTIQFQPGLSAMTTLSAAGQPQYFL
ncbi:MAG TPA: hypothetical protein VFC39_14945 [Acidobacteriaceae bacterium]|nr:hypothetical protein [Acidobacteriaceae bacterium]